MNGNGADISLALKSARVVTLCTEVLKKKRVSKEVKEYVQNVMFTALSLMAEDAIMARVGETEFNRLCGDVQAFTELKAAFLRGYRGQVEELENMKGVIFNIDDILAGFDPKI